MQLYALFLIPLAAGAAAFAVRSDAVRRGLAVGTAVVRSLLTLSLSRGGAAPALPVDPEAWLYVDATGLLFLSIVSLLILVPSCYTGGYLRREHAESHHDIEEGFYFRNAPEAVFTGCLLLFLSAMTLVTECQHFGLLWVAGE